MPSWGASESRGNMADAHILKRLTRDLEAQVERLRPPEDLEQRFGPYRDRPVEFVRECLGAKLEPYQVEIPMPGLPKRLIVAIWPRLSPCTLRTH